MLPTSARLLKLLSLLQTHREWSGTDLAERLEIDVRTVRRDVSKLRTLGYPVNAAPGVAGGYQLGAGAKMPPLLLDDEEAVAVAMGLRTAASGSISGIEESSVRALTKLEQVLPPRLRTRVNAMQTVTVSTASSNDPVDAEALTIIATAARDRERMRFEYRTHDGSESIRNVEPHRLVHTGRRWYLQAFDIDREDWRSFRVDRMRPRTPTGPSFEAREIPEFGVDRFAIWKGQRYQARYTLHAPVAQMAEQIPERYGMLEAIDDETCTLYTGSNWLDGLAMWLVNLGVDFEIHEPPELVEYLRQMNTRLARALA
ncbi:helix-turn-helix transcriptional regulator [Stackebrandtia nassauensis]|uniref:Helix-turn-helix type 11 domain protein n=1 Tax=Stackebrandtia nassauensis (strain DSM 44728 / CIP 108903 / NRRL B-16338 / NBRC 102104 / LLR-40K-21) TaxID=446470 RepID=D3PVX4_STANL|nr:YafY family protein [Stackebrandtia nassauensis]ADD45095.1 Helix-turn-helix type 11 domain protein [Stackebrandtia nassauensis DSM 44728]